MPASQKPYRLGVGAVILLQNGIFSGTRCDMPNTHQMPQGGIDPNEDPEHALARELAEETSIVSYQMLARTPEPYSYDFPPELAKTVCGGKYRGQQQHWFLLRFTGNLNEINIHTAEPEFSAWSVKTPDELIFHAPEFKKPLYRRIFTHFAAYLP
jgi:putative (di)nucleoside polyphosphate hydrolase